MNTHSGIVNTDSGNPAKVFTINQNGCSPSARISVHDQSESVFTMGRNMHYQFDTVKIAAVELPPEQYEQGIRKDSGHAQQMGITSLPAIVLLRSDGLFDIVSQAPVSYSDLQKRLLVGAKRLGIISEAEFNSTRPISNITNTLVSLPESQGTNNSSVPIPADQIIKAFNGGK